MNTDPNFKPQTHIPYFRGMVLQNFPFIEKDFDAITDYQLLCKVVEYLNKVIEQQNNLSSNMNELIRLYNLLKDFIEHYFDNLDVQEEINNKLDDMVEDGTLQEIIADYLNSKAVFGFDNVAGMKDATNLLDGSYAKTLGYYEINDGGNATYKIREITNLDVVNEMDIISLSDENLIAELIVDKEVNVKQMGAYGDETHNDSSVIQYALTNYDVTIIPVGTFLCGNISLTIPREHTLKGVDKNNSVLKYNGTDIFIKNEDDNNNNYIVIENLKIRGVDKHGIGICLSRTASVDGYGASWHRLSNLIINGFETGLEVRKNQNETQFSDIHCRDNVNGIRVINGVSDMYFERIVCSRNTDVGIYLFQVTETRFSDLKCWFNGNKTGAYNNMRIDSCLALMFVNLSLQDAYGNNCYISSSNNINMINTWFDTPQNDTVDTCYQLKLNNVTKSTFNIKGRNRKIDNTYVNKILQLDGDLYQNEIIFNCEDDFPYSQFINETFTATSNNVGLKNIIKIDNISLQYNSKQNFIVNGNLQDKSTLNFINSGKDNCTWESNKIRATAGESDNLTLGFKTGARNNVGLHTFYIKFDVVTGSGNVTFKNNTKACTQGTRYYMSFTPYFDNTNRNNGYLTMEIPAGMVIDIYEIGCVEGACAELNYPLSLTALS